MELWNWPSGKWMATQVNYTTDLLSRVLGPNPEEWPKRKTPLAREPEAAPEAQITPEAVKRAQKCVGELVWLSSKCRPDLCYVVARMASLITRDPDQVESLASHVWGYLAASVDFGLVFENQSDCRHLNVFTDASFGEDSHGCILIMFGESLILWKSSRQGVVSVSTAESELIEIMNGACSGDAVRVVIEEALNLRIIATSFSDSTSALSVITADTGTWRTRHLRKRASALRARVISGDWLVKHLPGANMPADLGTKALGVEKFNQLRSLLGMVEVEKETKKENGSCRGSSQESRPNGAAVKALKALILAAKLAQVKGEEGLIEVYKVQFNGEEPKKVEGGGYLLMVCAAVLIVGILCGLCLAQWCYDLEMEELRANLEGNRERPAFLQAEEKRRTQNEMSSASSSATNQVLTIRRRKTKQPTASFAIPAGSAAAGASLAIPAGSAAAAGASLAIPAGSAAAGASFAIPAGSAAGASFAIPAGSAAGASAVIPAGSAAAVASPLVPAGSAAAVASPLVPAGSAAAAASPLSGSKID